MLQITVKFLLASQEDVCKPYRPGYKDCPITRKDAERIERKYPHTSGPYPLPAGQSVALPLKQDFQQALISCIGAKNYAVLLEFDWGYNLSGAVDMVRVSSGQLPNPHPQVGQYWYTHQNAIDFDPSKRVEWQVTVNRDSFLFYVVPAA